MNELTLIIEAIVLTLGSITWHELAHAVTAIALGDPTPRRLGHLTLNPIKHTNQYGLVLVVLSAISFHNGQAFGFGFCPVDEQNMKPNPKAGGGIVAVAGPISNVILAVIFAAALHFIPLTGNPDADPRYLVPDGWYAFGQSGVILNLALAVFNILPIPPLDGWRVLETFLSSRTLFELRNIKQYGPLLLILVFLFGPSIGLTGALYNNFVYPVAELLMPGFHFG